MERMQFTFYRSFFETLSMIQDEHERLAVYEAIASYSLDGKEPELTGTPAVIFTSFKRTLDLARIRSERGKKGGSNRTSIASTSSASNSNRTSIASTSDASNVNVNVNENENVNVNVNGNGSEAARPTTEQVRDFFRKMNLKGDPDRFWMFNESKGWTIDNWQLAAVGWSKNEGNYEQETGRDAPRGDLLMKAVNKRKETQSAEQQK